MSGKPDFEIVRPEPVDVPERTPDGRPWVRWIEHGEYHGWYTAGTRRFSRTTTFWETMLAILSQTLDTRVDEVHACSPGILAMGPLGVTFRSGFAQRLLVTCLMADPVRFIDVMSPVLQTGARARAVKESPSGIVLVDVDGNVARTEAELRALLLLGSDGKTWTRPEKEHARIWVTCLSTLLRHEPMDRAQVAFIARVLPRLLSEELASAVRWSKDAAEQTWQYPTERQVLWALAMLSSMPGYPLPGFEESILLAVREEEDRRARGPLSTVIPEHELLEVLARKAALISPTVEHHFANVLTAFGVSL